MKVAVFQSACGGLDLDTRIARLRQHVARAPGVELVVCPELFSSGYNVGDDLRSLAAPATGSVFQKMAELASELGVALIYGYPERAQGGALHNAAAFVSPSGELLANHRKRLNSPHSFEEQYFEPGTHATVVDFAGVRIAVLICYEIEFPESVRAAALAGVQLIAAPTALVRQWHVVAERLVPTRAFESGVWVAYANHAGHENGFDYLGGSTIVAPDGEIVANAGADEGLISAEIDVECVTSTQARLPYLRDYSAVAS